MDYYVDRSEQITEKLWKDLVALVDEKAAILPPEERKELVAAIRERVEKAKKELFEVSFHMGLKFFNGMF